MRKALLITGVVVVVLLVAAIYVVFAVRRSVAHALGTDTFSAAAHISDQINKVQGGRPRPWVDYQPPKVTLPNPNAFDVYLKAIKRKDEIDRQYHAGKYDHKDRGEFAGGTFHSKDKWYIGPIDLPPAQRLPLYADVLKLTRQAFAMDCRLPPPGGLEAIQPYLHEMRDFGTLFQMEGSVLAEKDQFGTAASSLLDALKVARDLGTQRSGIALIMEHGLEISSFFRYSGDVLPRLSASEREATLSRLLKLEASRVPFREVIDGEEAADKSYFNEIMHDPSKLQFAIEMWPGTDAPGTRPPMDFWKSWDELSAYFDQLRAAAGRPLAQAGRFTLPQNVPARYLAWDWTKMLMHDATARTCYHLAELHLAVRRYLLANTRLPSRLDDLAPVFIPAVPSDPFGTGPMRATTSSGALVIYSIGPDGIDDGGRPVEDPNRLEPTSKGDIFVTIPAH